MKTLSEYFKRDSAYWGERSDWLVACTTSRDADCLDRSNWRSFIKALGGTGEQTGQKGSADITDDVAIEEANHWAVGWVQYLLISPRAGDLISKAEEIIAGLDGYPVVDEDDFSELEWSEYCEFFERDAQGEFARDLGRKFELCDAARDVLENAPTETLREWFESMIPSGEYHHDGYPCFSYAFENSDRDDVARLLRSVRASAKQTA